MLFTLVLGKQVLQKPGVQKDAWLGTQPILRMLEPDPPGSEVLDCYWDMCGPAGGFIDLMMKKCNSTVLQINTQAPMTPQIARSTVESCLCGKTDDDFEELNGLWQQCVGCLASGWDTKRSSVLNYTSFENACRCTNPGKLEALTHMTDPSFVCYERTRSQSGGRRPPKVQFTTSSASVSQSVTQTQSVTSLAVTSATIVPSTRTV
ncbi:hypothetical protein EDD86DRAFT_249232 [Gorgonomyces haynaldii]|nr:hypothetical protein EDD86DRAFT_249232 [Gorgonomyces haynaldii]